MNNQQRFSGEWETKRLGNIFSIRVGSSKSRYIESGGRYIIVDMGSVATDGRLIISKHTDYEGDFLKEGDLVMPKDDIGGGKIIGKVAYIDANNLYVLGDHVYALRLVEGHSKFYSYLINCYETNNSLKSKVAGSAQLGLSRKAVEEQEVPVPTHEEQRAIAKVLSDVDGLINALDALIAKKRAIKQATMQQLLTGKTRLPGFSSAWETKRLRDLFSIRAGSSKSQYIKQGGGYIIVDMGSVSTDGRLIISKHTDYEGDFLKEGDLAMPKDDIGGGKIIGKVAYIDANNLYVLGDHVYALRLIKGFPKFFSYLINRYETNSSLKSKVGGSAQLGLSRKAVEEQEVPVPIHKEQRAIATVLSDMDAEIAALEHRRDKTIAIKQGIMQQLLTGRVRLLKSQV